ncbi:hypothetical protein JW758_05835 [Candidatus Peregrinibacteria bacterium]|nr:hypothetical protein [Candidatus Peregrinibacteria bacterium]
MERFLSLKYYFEAVPDPNFQYTKLSLAIGILLIVSGFALSFYRKRYLKDQIIKKVIRKYPPMLRLYGILVLILLLIRETGIPYLSIRFLWVLLMVFFLYSLLKALITYKREYKRRLAKAKKQGSKSKYLPKKKKK